MSTSSRTRTRDDPSRKSQERENSKQLRLRQIEEAEAELNMLRQRQQEWDDYLADLKQRRERTPDAPRREQYREATPSSRTPISHQRDVRRPSYEEECSTRSQGQRHPQGYMRTDNTGPIGPLNQRQPQGYMRSNKRRRTRSPIDRSTSGREEQRALSISTHGREEQRQLPIFIHGQEEQQQLPISAYVREEQPDLPISEPLLQKIVELVKGAVASEAAPSTSEAVNFKSPFTSVIAQERADPKKKLPPLDPYNGRGDPYDHTHSYQSVMNYYNYSDAAMCRMFETTLKDSAKQWFMSLPNNGIGSWKELCDRFHERFGSNKRRGKLTASLMQIKQKSGESLSQYVQRFRDAVGTVAELNMIQALGFFTTGLDMGRNKKLMKDIIFSPPTDLADAYERAEKFIAIDEAMASLQPSNRNADRPEHNKGKDNKANVWDRIGSKVEQSSSGKTPFQPRTENKTYTPLNTDRMKVLQAIRNKSRDTPRPSDSRQEQSVKYCQYHRQYGHATDDCTGLKNMIEKKVQRGELNQFVVGRANRVPESAPATNTRMEPEAEAQPRRVVDVITGGSLPSHSGKKRRTSGDIIMALSNPAKKVERPFRDTVISFTAEDYPTEAVDPHEGALVITAQVGPVDMRRILIDNGSSVDVLYSHAYQRMGLEGIKLEVGTESPLYGFGNEAVPVVGTVELPVVFGTAPKQTEVKVKFFVVHVDSAYNAILGRTTLSALQAVTSIAHFKMKFPTAAGVGEVKGDLDIAQKCYRHTLTSSAVGVSKQKRTMVVDVEPFTEGVTEPIALPAEETEEVELIPGNASKLVRIGARLPSTLKSGLIELLQTYADIFAWTPKDMPGIAEKVAVHRLSVDPSKKPVHQKRRIFAPDRQKIIDEEVGKLLDAGIIAEIDYPEWLANVVLVRKQNGKWRVCIDYTDLNKACPKDFYPLPHIDQMIDATSGNALLSFLDAFSGYNQIFMAKEDIPKTAFITHRAIYAYNRMSFGLINAGATYQRMMNYVFRRQIGKNMEVYVDDMIVKSLRVHDHLQDLEECFQTVRNHNMRLNPTKCTFGLGSGKFLGYLVSRRGIEANPEKIKAILDMKSPQNFKDVQRLTGRVAALRRFMSRSAERCLPFFDTLKGPKNEMTFQWTSECEDAFQGIKKYLSSAPLLQRPMPKELLYVYLAVSPLAVGAVLVREEGGIQHPVYYVSHALKDAETRYSNLEKCAFALLTASRKLRQYFQGRLIVIYTDQPLKKILYRPEASGRMVTWAIELSQYNLEYCPRTAIKGQALADFIVESMFPSVDDGRDSADGEGSSTGGVLTVTGGQSNSNSCWTLYVDGASNVDTSGAGVILTSPEGFKVQQAIRFKFRATNNEAEYEAIIAGLKLAKSLEVRHIVIFSDSQLVVKQILGEYEARGARMTKYLTEVKDLLSRFESHILQGIEREGNVVADALSKLAASDAEDFGGSIYLEVLYEPSILRKELMCIERSNCWMTPYLEYLDTGKLPTDKILAKRIKYRSSYFCLIDGDLFRRAYSSPLLKCLVPSEASYALREVHEGICGDHMGAKSLAYKLIRQGYYWPTMFQEAKEFVKRCPKCQLNSPVAHQPPEELSTVLSPIPFAVWGIDLLGPMPKAKGQVQYVIVVIDYMTKWVEAKPLRRINEQECLKFFKEYVVFRFGIPMVLVSDNGLQFVGSEFEGMLKDLGIQHRRSSVAHPQSNGQVEVTNRTLLNGIKRRLDEAKGRWPEELPSVLWAYRTTPRTTTGDSPFRLAYGTEALIPVEIGSTSFRVSNFKELYNEEGLRLNLDLLDEVRDAAVLKLAIYQQKTARHYNKKVRVRRFEVGDLVLREAEASTPLNTGKLMPNWEGPYEVIEMLKAGTYRLRSMDGTELKNTWHAGRLRKYYQ